MLGSTLEIALASTLRVHWGIHWEFTGEYASTITLFYWLSTHLSVEKRKRPFWAFWDSSSFAAMLFVDHPDDKSTSEKPRLFIAFFLSFSFIALFSALKQSHCARMRDFTPFAHKLFRKRKKNRPTNIFAVLLHPLLKKYLHKFYIIHPTIIYTAFTYVTQKLLTELLRPSLSNCLRGFYISHTQKFKDLYILSLFTALSHNSLENYSQSSYIIAPKLFTELLHRIFSTVEERALPSSTRMS